MVKIPKGSTAASNTLHTQKSMFQKPGKLDGYPVFMEKYAMRNGYDGPTMLKGAIIWNRMSPAQKNKFNKLSRPKNTDDAGHCDTGCSMKRKMRSCAKKRKRSCMPPKPRCAMRRKPKCPMRSKPKCAPMKRRCAPKRKPRCAPKRRARFGIIKCQNPGPIMNNGYLNFLRVYRRKHSGLKSKELVMRGARAWCRLSECKKDRYRRQACKVTTNLSGGK